MKKLSAFLKNKKGISLAETIVAISLLTIISIVIMTISVYSVKNEMKNVRNMEIGNLSENAIECFSYSANEEEFFSLLQKTNADYSLENHVFTLQKQTFTLKLSLSGDLLQISAFDNDNEQIYSLNYEK